MRVEHWFYTIPLRLRSLLRRSQMERELEEELDLHLTQRIEQGIAMGKTPGAIKLLIHRGGSHLRDEADALRPAE